MTDYRDQAVAVALYAFCKSALAGGPYRLPPEPDDPRTAMDIVTDVVGDSRGLGFTARDPQDRHPEYAELRRVVAGVRAAALEYSEQAGPQRKNREAESAERAA